MNAVDVLSDQDASAPPAPVTEIENAKQSILDVYRGVFALDRADRMTRTHPYFKAYIKRPNKAEHLPDSVLIQELMHLSYLKAHLELCAKGKFKGRGKASRRGQAPVPVLKQIGSLLTQDLATSFMLKLKKTI